MAVTLTSSRYFSSASAVTTTGDNTLANATNVYSENDSYATVSSGGLAKNELSDSYKFSNFGIGSEINSDCTITDIKYEVQFHDADVVADTKITLQQSNSSGTASDTYTLVSTKNSDDDAWQEVVNTNPLWGYSGASDPDNLKNSSYGIIATIGNNAVDKDANGFVDAIALSFSYELHLNASIQASSSSSAQLETEIVFVSSGLYGDSYIVDGAFDNLSTNWILDTENNGTVTQENLGFFKIASFALGSDLEESLSQSITIKNGQKIEIVFVYAATGTESFSLKIGTSSNPTKYINQSSLQGTFVSYSNTFVVDCDSQEEEVFLKWTLQGASGNSGSLLFPQAFNSGSILSVVEGDIETEIKLAGTLLGSANTNCVLETEIVLSGSANGASSSSAELVIPIAGAELDASVSGIAVASGELETVITLAGSANGLSAATGELETGISLSGSVTGSSTNNAVLNTEIIFVSSVAGSAIVNANLETQIYFNASVQGTSLTSATLQTGIVNAITGAVSVQILEDKYSVALTEKEKYSVALVGSEKYNVTKEN